MEIFGAKKNKHSGFSLIEILVVIAIIGILSTIVIVAINEARVNARDIKRIAEVKQLQKILELYYEKYGHYPISTDCGAIQPNDGWCNSVETLNDGHWIKDIPDDRTLAEFLGADPTDPMPASSITGFQVSGVYYYNSNDDLPAEGQWYLILFKLENTANALQDSDGVDVTKCNDDVSKFLHFGGAGDGFITVGICAK